MRDIYRPIDKERFLFIFRSEFLDLFQVLCGEKVARRIDLPLILPQIMPIRATPIIEMGIIIHTSSSYSPKVIETLCVRPLFYTVAQMPLSDQGGTVAIRFHSLGYSLFLYR